MIIKKNNNKKGFTLVEMVVTVALLVIIATVSAGPIVNIYKARAKSAAEEVSSMISQSKVDSLSGIDNILCLYYDIDSDCYLCRLAHASGENKGEFYKTVEFGNKSLNVELYHDNDKDSKYSDSNYYRKKSLKEDSNHILFVMHFNNQTGKIEYFRIANSQNYKSNIENEKLNDVVFTSLGDFAYNNIKFISNNEYDITLYQSTGFHEVTYIG